MSISGAYPHQALRSVEEEIDKLSMAYTKLYVENYQLKTENAKLRDALGRYIRPAYAQAWDRGNSTAIEIIENDVRELGIKINNE